MATEQRAFTDADKTEVCQDRRSPVTGIVQRQAESLA